MILCEDKAHLHFIKGYCEAAGWHERAFIMSDCCPGGTQTAEQYVRENFARILRTLRSRHGQGRNVVLIVMIDGDKYGVQERKEHVQQVEARRPDEPVAIFVPKRNIQSWMAFLDGVFQDEDVDYKNRYMRLAPVGKYGRRLREHCQSQDPGALPESLADACAEWARVSGL